MIKRTDGVGNWYMLDNMRGLAVAGNQPFLLANSSNAEASSGYNAIPTATGFDVPITSNFNESGYQYIYIAIRRGPMKVPTVGTSVFYPNAVAQADFPDSTGVPFPPDLVNTFSRNGTDRASSYNQFQFVDRLRSLGTPSNTLSTDGRALLSTSTAAEASGTSYVQLKADSQNITRGAGWGFAIYGNWIYYFWRRAPSFFDEVCYTGTGSGTTITHNLGVTPELVITKSRTNGSLGWVVWTTSLTNTDYWIRLDSTMAQTNSPVGYGGTFSASNYTIANTGPYGALNGSGQNFVAYLFATCAGVSKVGSYTGTGATQTINCGFGAGGSRFVLIKRTDTTGDWYVWDSARGMVSGTDPSLSLNTTAAEVNANSIYTISTGFQIVSTAAGINASGGTYIFLSIA